MRETPPPARGTVERGQAVLETALVIPILLALVSGYLGIMVQVQAQTRMVAAVSLASQAALAAPVGDQPDGCRYATGAFLGTVYGTPPDPAGAGRSSCDLTPPPTNGYFQVTRFGCPQRLYLSAAERTQPVVCNASAYIDFGRTPLGWIIFWKPQLTATATARPSVARQCGISVC